MAIQVVEFSNRGYKIRNTQRKLLNFENWVYGEVSKIERHFSKSDLKIDVIKKRQRKKCAPKLLFFNEKK